ncbi:MAG: QueT transporter family protein [Oscillospiraceae bacterium]
MHITTRKLTAAAVTGAAYAALTMLLAPISYGAIQCRVSEVLCILPFSSLHGMGAVRRLRDRRIC